jgi:hypothetical protein
MFLSRPSNNLFLSIAFVNDGDFVAFKDEYFAEFASALIIHPSILIFISRLTTFLQNVKLAVTLIYKFVATVHEVCQPRVCQYYGQ